ncbi:hypothetical protein [Paenibacillus caui]|uniref:hypothetical protein n=1 Tax=Paenibacillus caui TaxID=2873927 RepID=UPI001CA94D91|nr:hypothetical protein [Paenibacillus caui]
MTNDQLRSDIAQLTERLRQIRIEQGLPPEPLPRPQIVELPLAGALIKRLEPFKAIAVKLASILAQGHVTRVDVSKLEQYREYERLLYYSHGLRGAHYATGVRIVFGEIKRINCAIDEGKTADFDVNGTMRRIHFAISTFLNKEHGVGWDMYEVHVGYTEELRAAEAEMKRLTSDPAAFQAAYDEALTQIPTKGEAVNYE